ncbi:MAG TPA: archease [Thermoanaerobaculia bacterium]
MFEFLSHTADIRMRVAAPDLPDLFRDALRGLMTLLQPEGESDEPVRHPVAVESADATALLVDFLNEALARALTDREVYDDLVVFELDPTRAVLRGELGGHRISAFGDDVKAVTYHEANLTRAGDGWETVVVFDI